MPFRGRMKGLSLCADSKKTSYQSAQIATSDRGNPAQTQTPASNVRALPRGPIMALTSNLTIDIAFVAFLAAVALSRWTTMADSPLPPGTDQANWLAFGHALAGEHIRSSAVSAPPIVPLLMLGVTGAWGPFIGSKVLA